MDFEVVLSNKRKIGSGTFGRVYRVDVFKRAGGRSLGRYALKVLNDDLDPEPRFMKRVHSHPNVVAFVKKFRRRGHLNILYELMEDGDLLKFIRRHWSPTAENGLGIYTEAFAFQMFRGLAYLSAQRVLHLDIKPENLLVSRARGTLKITDFGCARMCRGRWKSHSVGTVLFNPPELLMTTTRCRSSADVWSGAVVLTEMVLKEPVFASHVRGHRMQLRNIQKVLGPWTKKDCAQMGVNYNTPPLKRKSPKQRKRTLIKIFQNVPSHNNAALLDLLTQMLQYQQDLRPHPWKVMAHPFFDRVLNRASELPNGWPLSESLVSFSNEERRDARRLGFAIPVQRRRLRAVVAKAKQVAEKKEKAKASR